MKNEQTRVQVQQDYPRIFQLGVEISFDNGAPAGVNHDKLHEALVKHGLDTRQFSELFGIQTCGPNGAYPWDVEAVLERMMSGKKTGTQLIFD